MMKTRKKLTTGIQVLLALALSFPLTLAGPAMAKPPPSLPPQPARLAPEVSLRAVSGETIRFRTQNGLGLDGEAARTEHVPHLVLTRNGALADLDERTLLVEVSSVTVPPTGISVSVKLETQDGDPDQASGSSERITVWDESRNLAGSPGITTTGVSVLFRAEFVAAPTGYFRYEVALSEGTHHAAEKAYTIHKDHAFLMESQWVTKLPEVRERSPGAAPDELVVYFSDMFPIKGDPRDPSSSVPRSEVTRFVQAELVPAMVEGFRTQTDLWGFAWDEAWTSYRPGKDGERLTVALTDGETWYHGPAPHRGNSGIAINVSHDQAAYDSLVDGIMSTYHHELFHNLQRNIHQLHGGNGNVSGAGESWDFFAEGTAVLASSVAQPKVQFGQTSGARAYLSQANFFLGREGVFGGDLNRSLGEVKPSHAALYWRFLYEQCGGMKSGIPRPATGMQIIRRTLSVLYSGQIVDTGSSADLAARFPDVMDEVLSGPGVAACPFSTYSDSLRHFARAIYALRLEGGRCSQPGASAACGFYDPDGVLSTPPAATLNYTDPALTLAAADQPFPAGIQSSYGIDFVEVGFKDGLHGQAVTIEFHADPAAEARFSVEILMLVDSGHGSRPRAVSDSGVTLQSLAGEAPEGPLSITVEAGSEPFNKLGLIITRLDAAEATDPVGAYTVLITRRAP